METCYCFSWLCHLGLLCQSLWSLEHFSRSVGLTKLLYFQTIKWEHHTISFINLRKDQCACSSSWTFLTLGTPSKWPWHSASPYRSAHPSLMPSSSCRCWKVRRSWWAPQAKGRPSSLPSTSWGVKEHWAPSVSTYLECGLHSWVDACAAVAFQMFNFKWKPKLHTWQTLYLTPMMPM